MDWGHGYFVGSGYSFGYYPETMPGRLHWAAAVQGHEASASHFRYLDAGCGQGFNLIVAAILHPDSEFVGVDFMPRHVAHGRKLAAQLGLDNVTFVEGDFTELSQDPTCLGEFDYAVCHGIATWIAPSIRDHLVTFVGKALKPGGVFYNSYNTLPGWLATQPLQRLVLLEQERSGPEAALDAAREKMAKLAASAPALNASQPGLKARLDSMQGQDPAYLLQEYNNLYWQPVFVSQMIEIMAGAKLDYLGTATLAEIFPAAIPAELRPMVEQEPLVRIREQLRDLSINQGFRRDIYVKGQRPFFASRQEAAIRAQRFAANPLTARPEPDQPYKIKAGGVELHGATSFYNMLLDRMAQSPHGCMVGELIDSVTDPSLKGAVVETLCMAAQGGWALPQRAEPAAALAAIAKLARAVSEGAPYRFLPLPRSGGALGLSETDWLLLDLIFTDTPRDRLPAGLVQSLKALNRLLLKDGQGVKDDEEFLEAAGKAVDEFLEQRWPFLSEQLGLAG